MAAGIYNLAIEQGSTFIRVFVWNTGGCGCDCGCSTESACSCSGLSSATPVNLTGYSADMQIRQTISSPTILYEASTAGGEIVLGGVLGTITLTIPAVDTAAFAFTKGVYDLQLTSGGDIVTRLLQGAVTVSPEVTR
jgi:hypothetical protein